MSTEVKLTRTITGRVVSNKMDKTVVVLVETKIPHPKYGKYVRRRSKIFAHDEQNQCKEGDVVTIGSCSPIAKNKTWKLLNIVESVSE